jgi:hypothetical protein
MPGAVVIRMDFDARSRIPGAVLFALVGAALAFDFWLSSFAHRFSGKLFVACFAALPVSLLFMIAGAPVDARTGERPRWFQLAAGASTLGGLALGFWLLLHGHWS